MIFQATNPRFTLVIIIFYSLSIILAAKITYLMIFSHDFLSNEGRKRSTQLIETAPVRGTIFDRFNQLLAVSTPVSTLWVNPKQFAPTHQHVALLNKYLAVDEVRIRALASNPEDKSFAYLARRISPEVASRIIQLSIPGVYERQEHKRFYPQSSMLAQTLGFTNIDQKGIEGIELLYNHQRSGMLGLEKRTFNLHKRVTRENRVYKPVTPGRDVYLTIDSTLQDFVEKALIKGLEEHAEKSVSAILVHAKTG